MVSFSLKQKTVEMPEFVKQELHRAQYTTYNVCQIKNAAVSVKNEILEMIGRVQEKMDRLTLPVVSAKYLAKIPNRDKVHDMSKLLSGLKKLKYDKEHEYDLAFTEVISYNKANLERVEQNESRQQDKQQSRTKRREKEI